MDKESFFKSIPIFIQNTVLSLYNSVEYKKRQGKYYNQWKDYFLKNEYLSIQEMRTIQLERLRNFIDTVIYRSEYYREKYKFIDISTIQSIDDLSKLPILKKEEILNNLDSILTIDKKVGHLSKTGGTTGNSMEVYYTSQDRQERFAMLDVFRERFSYTFGDKTAWFSGKDIVSNSAKKNKIFWNYNFINRIKYYSTFHIYDENIIYYVNDLRKFKPSFIVGFPSSIYEIARIALKRNLSLDGHRVTAIFPTAEKLNPIQSEVIKEFFGGELRDQYASSEGAPFITECEFGNKHFEILSGVIETVDQNNQPSAYGRMLVTTFTTSGTPLIRYDIGDSMEWENPEIKCPCRRQTPLVKEIFGRIGDFVYSRERGKTNLGNISNCVKGVKGINKFQIIQDDIDSIIVNISVDSDRYGHKSEKLFIQNLRARLGDQIVVSINYVDDIPNEKSGKYRIVKNSLDNSLLEEVL